MKRYNNLFEKIVSIDNLYLADKKARKNKGNRNDIKEFDKHKDSLLVRLRSILIDQTYTTSKYSTFIIREPKERLIFKLPLFRVEDRSISFVGYKIYHDYTLIRKNIKHKMCKKVAAMNKLKHMTYSEYRQQVCSHIGWMKHCNGINLLKKIIKYH
jgi:hypothetical protein